MDKVIVSNKSNEKVDEDIPLLSPSKIQLTNVQILVICINTITVRPLQKFISTFAAFLVPILGFSFTEIGYIIAARNYGSFFTIFFPSLIYWINSKYELSFRFILFVLHTTMALLCFALLFYDTLWFFIAIRFLFGICRQLFGIYRVVLGAAYSTKSNRIWIYSIFYMATPFSLPLLILFGILLQFHSFDIALTVICLPCLLTGFAFFVYLPTDSITSGINISIGNEHNLTYTYKILFDWNRICKIVTSFLNGIYIQMFTVCISAWVSDSYNIDASSYWLVITAIFIAETIGSLTTLSKIYTKYECLENGAILWCLSTLFGVIINGTIFVSESMDIFFTIRYWLALLLIALMYYAGTFMYVSSNVLTIVLVGKDNRKRSQYVAYIRFFFGIGVVCGSLLGTSMYEKGGIWLVTQIALYVSFTSFIICCILTYRLFRKDGTII
eukprot:160156_1